MFPQAITNSLTTKVNIFVEELVHSLFTNPSRKFVVSAKVDGPFRGHFARMRLFRGQSGTDVPHSTALRDWGARPEAALECARASAAFPLRHPNCAVKPTFLL
jgi:hypothetical protein